MIPSKLGITLLLAGVRLLFALFSFQAIADGKTTSALESGAVGLVLLGAAAFRASGSSTPEGAPGQRRRWDRLTNDR